jgi:hypothetical protein
MCSKSTRSCYQEVKAMTPFGKDGRWNNDPDIRSILVYCFHLLLLFAILPALTVSLYNEQV